MKKDLDSEILKILEKDARVSLRDLAVMLDSDEKTVEKKIRSLKAAGVIKEFKTVVDWKKMGRHKVVAFIQVKVIPQEKTGFAKICKQFSEDERVTDVFVSSGEYDIVIRVEADNIDEMSKFVTEKLAPKKEVTGTYTQIVLAEYKRDGVTFFDDGSKRLAVSL